MAVKVQDYRGEYRLVDPETGLASPEFLRFLQERGTGTVSVEELANNAQDSADQAQEEVDALELVVAALSLDDLADVDLTGLADGEGIIYNSVSGNFEPGAVGVASVAWGSITGTLSDQTDLQSELDGKADTSHTHTVSDITDLASYTGFDTRYYTETEVDGLVNAKQDLDPLLTDISNLTLSTGDLLYYDGADIVRLAIGSEEQVLTVTSGEPAWETSSAGLSKFPLVDGSVPPNLVYEEDGSLVYVEI